MPASSVGSPTNVAALAAAALRPLSAPLSRTEDVEVLPRPCQACGSALSAGWGKVDGAGVLMHRTALRDEACPVAVPFDWETGMPLPSSVGAVAA
jgi:hypothetical protein